MKPTFLNHAKPLITNMIQAETAEQCIINARNAIYDGADAIGLQLCKLKPEYRKPDIYRGIFAAIGPRPIYLTNYRHKYNEGFSDEACMEGLLEGMQTGGTLCDIMGDTFAPNPMELTHDSEAIKKQKELIDKVHSMGKEVLMSSHVCKFLPAEQVLEIALAHQERGADIAKIVTAAYSTEEELENLRITNLLKKELKIPFLFLSTGTHYKLHRMVGPMLGSAMCLCVQQHDALSTKTQPVLRAAKQVLDHLDYLPDVVSDCL